MSCGEEAQAVVQLLRGAAAALGEAELVCRSLGVFTCTLSLSRSSAAPGECSGAKSDL